MTSDIPVLYGVDILTDDYSVLSQYTVTDRQTDVVMMMMMMMKLPILPCAEKLELVLSTAPRT